MYARPWITSKWRRQSLLVTCMKASPVVRRSAQKSCSWNCSNQNLLFWTKPTPVLILTPCVSYPQESTAHRKPTTWAPCSSPTTHASCATSSQTTCTYLSTVKSLTPGAKNWPIVSKTKATSTTRRLKHLPKYFSDIVPSKTDQEGP